MYGARQEIVGRLPFMLLPLPPSFKFYLNLSRLSSFLDFIMPSMDRGPQPLSGSSPLHSSSWVAGRDVSLNSPPAAPIALEPR
jgi:hypothetical protein